MIPIFVTIAISYQADLICDALQCVITIANVKNSDGSAIADMSTTFFTYSESYYTLNDVGLTGQRLFDSTEMTYTTAMFNSKPYVDTITFPKQKVTLSTSAPYFTIAKTSTIATLTLNYAPVYTFNLAFKPAAISCSYTYTINDFTITVTDSQMQILNYATRFSSQQKLIRSPLFNLHTELVLATVLTKQLPSAQLQLKLQILFHSKFTKTQLSSTGQLDSI
ncbi:Hypothetical_protein [Hexamita inflata]|uniref:Hypothetical_protein n=1 Tax=Hexamita inflata TaxID=28002 RepID=A0AA86TUA6_9EUKA|nr:Hypothetical protein HINF_LOCUS16651 [Hexamita inflata]